MLSLHRIMRVRPQLLLQQPLQTIYIHLKDHNKKINPEDSKVNLSYMKVKSENIQKYPQQQKTIFHLKNRDQKSLEKKMFEDYKKKILEARIDEEEEVEVDPLWGEEKPPEHYYKFLSATQATWLSHSPIMDTYALKQQLVQQHFKWAGKISSIDQLSDINDTAELALYYRQENMMERKQWHEIEVKIGNKFHLLTNQSLIRLLYACRQAPKQCTPQFHKIIKDLLLEQIDNLSAIQLIYIFYANRLDRYGARIENFQLKLLNKLQSKYKTLSITQKIDWIFLFADSRLSVVPRKSHDRHWNAKRDIGNKLLYQIDLASHIKEFEDLSVKSLTKLVYSLTRMRLIHIDYFVNAIVNRCEQLYSEGKLSVEDCYFFFIYLTDIQNGRGINNIALLASLQGKILENWGSFSKINQLRTLWAMANIGTYDQNAHQLYKGIQIQVDNTILGYFCRLQFLNSSERQWQVIHMLANLDYFPVSYFQDYKRFYNYLKYTTEWNIDVIKDKLFNSECFINSRRFQNNSLDKPVYKNVKKFLQFSQSKLPKNFEIGVPIGNCEFVDFAKLQHQISVDILTDVHRIPGTGELKATAQNKIKSLENLGWKHFYIQEQDLVGMSPLQLFEHLQTECAQYIEEQREVLENMDNYQAYELERIRDDQFWRVMQGPQIQLWKNDPEKAAVLFEKKMSGQEFDEEYLQEKQIQFEDDESQY